MVDEAFLFVAIFNLEDILADGSYIKQTLMRDLKKNQFIQYCSLLIILWGISTLSIQTMYFILIFNFNKTQYLKLFLFPLEFQHNNNLL